MSIQFSGLLPVEANGRLRYRIKSKKEKVKDLKFENLNLPVAAFTYEDGSSN
jgi:hypothetical protein